MSNEVNYLEKLYQERWEDMKEDIEMLKDVSEKHEEALVRITMLSERINNTIQKIIDNQEEHAKRLKDIEILSFISRNWKFFFFTVLSIVTVSLIMHTTVKDLIGIIF